MIQGSDSAEDLLEHAPCGYLSTTADGTILCVNRTFEAWTGLRRDELIGRHRRFQELLTTGGRIYHETHCAPLLTMQGEIREIAVEIVRADGTRLPALVNSILRDGMIRTTVFDATDRRRYEEELLRGRQREHDLAVELQRSMLPGKLPDAGPLELGVTYRPAVRGLEIGGDWYDAFWFGEDTLGLVVGDVVGRGVGAAAAMGQLRSAFRALASTGLPPAALLDAVDRFARHDAVGAMSTLAHARVEVRSGRVRYACAGHLPPVLVTPGAEVRLLWDGRSLPLDAVDEPAPPRIEATSRLEPGATLLLYTDGLIERHDRSLDDGLDELIDAVEVYRHLPPAELTETLATELTRAGPGADDVCLLAVRRPVA